MLPISVIVFLGLVAYCRFSVRQKLLLEMQTWNHLKLNGWRIFYYVWDHCNCELLLHLHVNVKCKGKSEVISMILLHVAFSTLSTRVCHVRILEYVISIISRGDLLVFIQFFELIKFNQLIYFSHYNCFVQQYLGPITIFK